MDDEKIAVASLFKISNFILMEKIFVVTTGEYSDYRISGVFSTKEKAEDFVNFVEKHNANRYYLEIKEYGVDEFSEASKKGFFVFRVEMDKQGNSKVSSKSALVSDFDKDDINIWGGKLFMDCYAKDEKHATKIANEKRVQLIAEGKM